jgi:hypothetical protein
MDECFAKKAFHRQEVEVDPDAALMPIPFREIDCAKNAPKRPVITGGE